MHKDAVWIARGGGLVTKVPWKPLQTGSFPTQPHTARPAITDAMDTAANYRTEQSARRGEGHDRWYCISSGSRFGQRDRRRYFEHKKTYKVYNFTFITVLSMFVGVWAEVTPYTLKRWFTLTGAVSVDAVKTLRTETWQINSDTFFCWSRVHSVFILTYLQSLYHNMGAGNLQCTAYSPAHRNHCNTAASANKMAKHLTDYSL